MGGGAGWEAHPDIDSGLTLDVVCVRDLPFYDELAEEVDKESFCFGGFLVKVKENQGMSRDQQAEGEEREEHCGGEDGADEDRGDDEGPEGHEEEGHDMRVDPHGDLCSFGGIYEVTVGDGLPGVVPGQDAANDEAVCVEAADIGPAGVTGHKWEILSGLEVGFQALADLCGREPCR